MNKIQSQIRSPGVHGLEGKSQVESDVYGIINDVPHYRSCGAGNNKAGLYSEYLLSDSMYGRVHPATGAPPAHSQSVPHHPVGHMDASA